jgi:hypothetical protein
MPYTLHETLRQIDPYVQLSDGESVATVEHRLMFVDPHDLTQYALGVDAVGRLVIYRLNLRGYLISPAAFVEVKPPAQPRFSKLRPVDFGLSLTGYV